MNFWRFLKFFVPLCMVGLLYLYSNPDFQNLDLFEAQHLGWITMGNYSIGFLLCLNFIIGILFWFFKFLFRAVFMAAFSVCITLGIPAVFIYESITGNEIEWASLEFWQNVWNTVV